MVTQVGENAAVVTRQELGTNCWHPRRFVSGASRCERLYVCNYPEKTKCQAIHAEIAYLRQEQLRMIKISTNIDNLVEQLIEMTKI